MTFARVQISLAFRFTAQVVGLALVLGLLAKILGDGIYARRWEQGRQREALSTLMDVVEPSASAACFADDGVLADQIVRGLIGTAHVQGARIRSGDKVLAEASRPFPGPHRADYPEMTRPLSSPFIKDSILGELTLVPDAREAERLGSRTAAIFQLGILGTLAVFGVMLAFMVRIFISAPLREIAQRLRDFNPASGTLLKVPKGHGRTEIGGLVKNLNDFARRLVEAAWKAQEAPLAKPMEPAADSEPAVGLLVVRGNGALEAWTKESLRLLGLEENPPLPGALFQSLFGPDAARAQACLEQCRAMPGRSSAIFQRASTQGRTSRQVHVTFEVLGPDWIQVFLEGVNTAASP